MSPRRNRRTPARLLMMAVPVLSIASCAKPQTSTTLRPPPPTDLPAACPAGVPLPKPPARPRTVEQLGEWARRTAAAGNATEQARVQCARDYQRLRAWTLVPG